MRYARYLGRALFLTTAMVWMTALVGADTTITFESISSGTFVRDQFQGLGLRVTGAGSFSGLVYSEGSYGVVNYGNSPTQIVDVGSRGEPTTLQFVDPASPTVIIGASAVSLRLGDGDPDSETFTVTYFDVSGGVLLGPVQYTTTSAGLVLSQTSTALGGLIGSVRLELLPTSPSGVTFDDLAFTLAPTTPACAYTFSGGSGSAAIGYCLSANGSMVSLVGPAGQEHVGVDQILEGYVVCSGTTVQAWDLADSAGGFGAPTVVAGPSASGITLRRSSAQYRLDQAFKLDKLEKDVTITMTLTNISVAAIPDVRLTRAYDPDVNNDAGDDLEARSTRGVWASDVDGVTLTGITWSLPTDTAVDTGSAAACSPPSGAAPVMTNDGSLAAVTYRLGSLKAGAKKVVVFVYRVQ